MTIYYILLFGTVAFGIPLCKSKILTKVYLALVFTAFFVIAAVRKTSGYDYNLYAGWYNGLVFWNYEQITLWSREKGFTVPLKVLTVISSHYQMMFVVIAFIIALGVTLYIYRYSSRAYISAAAFISLGLYYNSLNFMRQFIAAIIVSFAFSCIDKKQPARFLTLVLFASCFHYSALLIIPFYVILMIKLNWVTLSVYCVIAAGTFIFSAPILEFVTEYFYKGYDPVTSKHMLMGLPVSYTVIFGVLFIAFFIFRKDLIKRRSLNSVLLNAYFFAVYFEFMGIKHSVVSRFALLFLIAPVIALTPDLVLVITEKKGRLLRRGAAACFCLYALTVNTLFLVNNYNGVVPYQTVFDETSSE